jgi:hypothetical protein
VIGPLHAGVFRCYVDPSPYLASNGSVDGSCNTGGQGRLVDGDPVFAGKHDLDQIIRPGQAAHVRGEKAIRHGSLPAAVLIYDPTIACGPTEIGSAAVVFVGSWIRRLRPYYSLVEMGVGRC